MRNTATGSLLSTYYAPVPLMHWDLPWEAVTGALFSAIVWLNKGRVGQERRLSDGQLPLLCRDAGAVFHT
jgi:hypothetical protein